MINFVLQDPSTNLLSEVITAELDTIQTRNFNSARTHLSAGPIPMQGTFPGQCACCPQANLPRLNNKYRDYKNDDPIDPHQEPRHYQQSRYENKSCPVDCQ